jgi:hypothetical protein
MQPVDINRLLNEAITLHISDIGICCRGSGCAEQGYGLQAFQ